MDLEAAQAHYKKMSLQSWPDEAWMQAEAHLKNAIKAEMIRRAVELSSASSVPTTGRAERPSELLTVNPDWTLERCLQEVISVYSKLHQLPLEDLVINHHMYSSNLHLTWRWPMPYIAATEEAGASGAAGPDWATPHGWNEVPPVRRSPDE